MAIIIAGCSSIEGSSGNGTQYKSTPDTVADNRIQYNIIDDLMSGYTEIMFHDTLLIEQKDLNSVPHTTTNTSFNVAGLSDISDGNGNTIVAIQLPYVDDPIVKAMQTGFYNSTFLDFNYNYWNTISFAQDGSSNKLESVFYGYNNKADIEQYGIYNSTSTRQGKNGSVNISQNGNNNSVKIIQH